MDRDQYQQCSIVMRWFHVHLLHAIFVCDTLRLLKTECFSLRPLKYSQLLHSCRKILFYNLQYYFYDLEVFLSKFITTARILMLSPDVALMPTNILILKEKIWTTYGKFDTILLTTRSAWPSLAYSPLGVVVSPSRNFFL